MKHIVLMCDYGAEPVWSGGDNVPLDDLPLTEDTKEALRRWSQTYERALDWSRADELAFEAEGERLLEIVRRDLGEGWEVTLYREPEATAAD